MKVNLAPGSYVVAVSGGVDSVVLLDMLRRQSDLVLSVAHFDHGMRTDSSEDRQAVQDLADEYKLPFIYDEGHLGSSASEATARAARYRFLRQAKVRSGSQAIVTAHHQDDVLETAILNILRGTGRRGLSSLGNGGDLMRPLLHIPKAELLAYAKLHELSWREDSSNQDQRYLRNYIRHRLLSRFDAASRQQLVAIITQAKGINDQLDIALINQLHTQPSSDILDRRWFNQLPHNEAKEVLAAWLRLRGLRSFEATTLERAVVAAKVGHIGDIIPLKAGVSVLVKTNNLTLVRP